MWFACGILTLILAVILGFRTRMRASWSGNRDPRLGGYVLQEVRFRGRPDGRITMVRIGVSAPDGFHFRIRAERVHDWLFKALGVCLEIQTRDPEFDRQIFIESDARGVAILLGRRAELRRGLLNLFSQARAHDLKGVTLHCSHGRLWLQFKPDDENLLWKAQQALVPILHELSTGLGRHGLSREQLLDRFVPRAAAFLALSTASLLLGLYGLIRSTGRTDILDPWALFVACIVPGLLAAGVVLFLVASFLGSSSRAHLVLTEVAVCGTAGLILSVYALARDANVEFDHHSAVMHETSQFSTAHTVSRDRRGRRYHHYYVDTADWRPANAGQPLRLEINGSTYRQLQGAPAIRVHTKSGALGYEWVERIEDRPW